MGHMDSCIAEADTSVGRCEGYIRSRLHIHAIEHSPAQIAPGVFQGLLAPQVTDGVASDVDRALIRLMPGPSIIRSAGVGFKRMGEYIEAWIRRCHGWQRHRVQRVNDRQRGTQVAM